MTFPTWEVVDGGPVSPVLALARDFRDLRTEIDDLIRLVGRLQADVVRIQARMDIIDRDRRLGVL